MHDREDRAILPAKGTTGKGIVVRLTSRYSHIRNAHAFANLPFSYSLARFVFSLSIHPLDVGEADTPKLALNGRIHGDRSTNNNGLGKPTVLN